MPRENDARVWLRTAGFEDLADKIDQIMASWKKRDLKTRRNWWEALAGTPRGTPMTVEGVQFPMIAAVRQRLGLDPAEGAIELAPSVVVPPLIPQVRWKKKKKKRPDPQKRSRAQDK